MLRCWDFVIGVHLKIVRRPFTFSNISETTGPIPANFYENHQWAGRRIIVQSFLLGITLLLRQFLLFFKQLRLNHLKNFNQTQKCSLCGPLPRLFKLWPRSTLFEGVLRIELRWERCSKDSPFGVATSLSTCLSQTVWLSAIIEYCFRMSNTVDLVLRQLSILIDTSIIIS